MRIIDTKTGGPKNEISARLLSGNVRRSSRGKYVTFEYTGTAALSTGVRVVRRCRDRVQPGAFDKRYTKRRWHLFEYSEPW